MGIYQGQLF